MKEIARGAEAVIYKDNGSLVKDRVKKNYRLAEIDHKLRTERTKTEARLLSEARRAGVPTPLIEGTETNVLRMAFIAGDKVRDVIDTLPKTRRLEIAKTMGRYIGALHRNGIIHGDLTTSNMIIADQLYFIDFGLGTFSKSVEDRAVDLYLLHNAIKSTHYKKMKELWKAILDGYTEEFTDSAEVLGRLKKIELRGRYTRRLG